MNSTNAFSWLLVAKADEDIPNEIEINDRSMNEVNLFIWFADLFYKALYFQGPTSKGQEMYPTCAAEEKRPALINAHHLQRVQQVYFYRFAYSIFYYPTLATPLVVAADFAPVEIMSPV